MSNPTLRSTLGAAEPTSLSASTALLVIDFQKEYFTGKLPIPDGEHALDKTRELIRFADANGLPVFHIQHIAPAGSALFAIDSDTVNFQPGMEPRATDTVLQKTTVSVFASTDLAEQLKRRGVDTIIIAGLMTHACVAGAARDGAEKAGLNVVVASDATATRAITRANGDTIDQDSLHRAALAEVEDTFGDVMTTAEIVKLPVR